MVKTLNKLVIEGKYHNIVRITSEKPIVNIISNGKKMELKKNQEQGKDDYSHHLNFQSEQLDKRKK